MDGNMGYAALVAALGLVCWPSPRWQRLLLGVLAMLARVGVLGALAGLGFAAAWPGDVPESVVGMIDAAAARNHVGPPAMCLLLAALVASAAVPVLAGLDFARSLADERGVSRALRAALEILKQYEPAADPGAVPTVFPPAAYRPAPPPAPAELRRVGDLRGR